MPRLCAEKKKTYQKPTKHQKHQKPNQPKAKVTPETRARAQGPSGPKCGLQTKDKAQAKAPRGLETSPPQALPPQSPIRPRSGVVTAGRELRSAFRPSKVAVAITCQGGFFAACAVHPAPCALCERRAPRAARRARRARRGSTGREQHMSFQQGGYGGLGCCHYYCASAVTAARRELRSAFQQRELAIQALVPEGSYTAALQTGSRARPPATARLGHNTASYTRP